jgi:ribosome-associated protein
MKPEDVHLPEEALSESFLASTGPGGQNVNKVATACQLRCDIHALGLPLYAHEKLRSLAGSKLTQSGELVITARTHRSQEANREEARRRLRELIAEAHHRDRKRRPTRPSKAAKAKRVEAKKGRGAVKAMRGRVSLD